MAQTVTDSEVGTAAWKGSPPLYTPIVRILIDASCCLGFVYWCITRVPSVCTVKLDRLSFILLTNDL